MDLKKIYNLIDTEINKDFSNNKVLDYKTPVQMNDLLDLEIKELGSEEALFNSVDNYLQGSVDTAHPMFTNQLWSGRNYPALVGEILTSLRNTSVYTYETAPAATMIEIYMIDFLCKQMGYENGDGTFLTGSSNANLISLLVARNTMFPEIKSKGLKSAPELCFFVSEKAHYSFEKAANVLGFGEENVIKVKTEKDYKMSPSDLENQIKKSIELGKKPFYVCGTAGTTEIGAFDPLEELQVIAKKYNMWFHTDGAWGGALVFSEKYKGLLKGIKNSDSISWDAHKLMGIPLICSVILLKNKNQLLHSVCEKSSDYLFHEHEHDDLDLGKKSIQCGRRVDSLKLWLSLKYYGLKGYENRINRMVKLANYMSKKVASNSDLELIAPTYYCNINFRYNPKGKSKEEINNLNLRVREEIYKEGKALFNYCYINGDLSIRYIIANPEITERNIDDLLEMYVAKCREIESN